MNLNEEQQKTFEQSARPLIKWINENCHPMVTVVVDGSSAELSENICCIVTTDYVKD